MPKPGSIFSILSQSSLVRRLTSRIGRDVPTRIASMRLSTRIEQQIQFARAQAPLLPVLRKLLHQNADVARDGFRAPIGSAKLRRTCGVSGGMMGSKWLMDAPIGLIEPQADRQKPKRRASGARGVAFNSPMRSKPSFLSAATISAGRRSAATAKVERGRDLGAFQQKVGLATQCDRHKPRHRLGGGGNASRSRPPPAFEPFP